MAGEGFFFYFLKQYFIVFIFDLHMYCDDMQINWDRLFFPPPLFVVVMGCLKCTVPCPSWCAGSGSRCRTVNQTLTLVLEDFMILWLAANY